MLYCNISYLLAAAGPGRPGHNLRKKVKMSTCGGIVLDKTGAGVAANSELLLSYYCFQFILLEVEQFV
jgi:hypothetical protein